MAYPRYEVPTGVIDSVNVTFTTAFPYVPGSTAVFLNGQLKRIDFVDGWIETNPGAGVFTMKEAPITNDVVQLFYLDSTINLFVTESVCGIVGILSELDEVAGSLVEVDSLTGLVDVCEPV